MARYTADAEMWELGSNLGTPWILTPEQWAEARKALRPEAALMAAVLEDALRVYIAHGEQGPGGRPARPIEELATDSQRFRRHRSAAAERAYQEARHWLLDAHRDKFAFSCEDICDYLEIDATALREAVRNGAGEIGRRRPVVSNYPLRAGRMRDSYR